VLDLDARVHLHEEVVVALDDALEGRHRVEASPRRTLALGLHARERTRSPLRAGLARLAGRARSASATSSSFVSETSTSFCSCICTEQSRPPSERHHSPLPMSWISLWRVRSMLSSIRKFRFEPARDLDSENTSRRRATCSGFATALALAAAAADVLEADAMRRVVAPDPRADPLGLPAGPRFRRSRLLVAGLSSAWHSPRAIRSRES
jgi:hypothetical protein